MRKEHIKRRLAISTEFSGNDFHGWQRQDNAVSVQETLENAWRCLTGEAITLTGSSRTDTGVSALRHISSFVTASSVPTEKVPLAWNTALPPGVVVRKACQVEETFNPRFDACGKTYVYRYYVSPTPPVLSRFVSAHICREPDLEAMRLVADDLCGTHDFTAFMDQGSVARRTVRTLFDVRLTARLPYLELRVTGDGFLYHMMRIMAGTLYYVGIGKLSRSDVVEALIARDRTCLGPTMPPEGLILERVYYVRELFGQDAWPFDTAQSPT